MRRDAIKIDALPCQCVELAVVGLWIDTPEARTADVREAWTEALAQQPEQPEHDIAVSSGIGHYVCGMQLGLLLQHDR